MRISRFWDHSTRHVFAIFSIRACGAGLSVILSLITARLLGAKGYGICAYALSWVAILCIPAKLGTDNLIVREVAIYTGKKLPGKIKGIYSWANRTVLTASFVILLIAIISFRYIHGPALFFSLLIALGILPFSTLSGIRQSVLRGSGKIAVSLLPELIARPIFLIAAVAIVWFAFKKATAIEVLWIYLLTAILMYLVYDRVVHSHLTAGEKIKPTGNEIKSWISSLLPFALLDATYIINSRADVVMIGMLKDPQSAGIYNVATNGADIISFMLAAVNMTIAPSIAIYFNQGNMKAIQRIMSKSARIALLGSLPVAVIIFFWGGWLLHFFGKEFVLGEQALVILSVSQIVNVAAGSVGLLLKMSGHERIALIAFGIASAGNIVLNLILIPIWGINGAAIATFTSTVVWNLILFSFVFKKMKINPSAIG